MKIGIISDSHGNTQTVDKAVKKAADVQMWLHAGDYIQDAEYLSEIVAVPVVKVAGNGDWNNIDVPEDEFINIGNKKIWLTHGHKYQIKWGIDCLRQEAEKNNADVIIFGHNHVYSKQYIDNRLFINPGSIALPRDGEKGSFAVMNFLENKTAIDVQRYTI
ncbi:metallophosphoesterase family protein [Pectinatus frisingensis]|uniref:metallophosphoesterase family protein n=1 Tax=Pectinatus frisingensis TaxID=865 RepID=UPI0018C4A4B8|nr:metallophosphoesterase [Pectinatus frisingensis]